MTLHLVPSAAPVTPALAELSTGFWSNLLDSLKRLTDPGHRADKAEKQALAIAKEKGSVRPAVQEYRIVFETFDGQGTMNSRQQRHVRAESDYDAAALLGRHLMAEWCLKTIGEGRPCQDPILRTSLHIVSVTLET